MSTMMITGDEYEILSSGHFSTKKNLTWFILNYNNSEDTHIVAIPMEYGESSIIDIFNREFLEYDYPLFKSVASEHIYFLVNNADILTIENVLKLY